MLYVIDLHISKVTGIRDLERQRLAVGGRRQDLRGRIVDGDGELPVGIFVLRRREAVVIELGVDGDDDGRIILQHLTGRIHAVPRVDGRRSEGARGEDRVVIRIIDGLADIIDCLAVVGLTGLSIRNAVGQGLCVTEQGGVDQVDLVIIAVRAQGRERIVLRIVGQLRRIGVAAEHIEAARSGEHAAAVVQILAGPVRLALQLLPVVADVDDRGLIPVAVEGKVGDRKVAARDALGRGLLRQGDVALNVDAVFKRVRKLLAQRIGELDRHGHIRRALGGNGHDVIGAVRRPCRLRRDIARGLRGKIDLYVAIIALRLSVFRQDGRGDGVLQRFGSEVHHAERHLIFADLVRIVAELQLRALFALNLQIGLRRHGGGKVYKTCALLARGRRYAVAALGRDGRAHHQRVGQRHGIALDARRAEVLQHQCAGARQMRRRHGRAGHQTIGIVVTGRIDVAAGSHDVRRDLQLGRRAPGRERGGLPARLGGSVIGRVGNGQRPDAVLGGCDHCLTVCLRDKDRRDRERVDAHVDHARLGVIDDAGCRTLGVGHFVLFCKRCDAAADERDLALDIQVGVIRLLAVAGHDNIVKHLAAEYADEAALGVVRRGRIRERDLASGRFKVGAADGHVVGARHGQGLGIGARGADDAVVRVGRQRQVRAPQVLIGGGVFVACGRRNDDAGLGQTVIDLHRAQQVAAVSKAGGGAEREVHDVDAERDAVFQRGKDIIGVCAGATVREDLQDHELSLRRNAGDAAVRGVGCNDTGNVRAVVGAAVMVDVRVVIGIVEHIGDLAAQVDTAGGEVPHKALRLQRACGKNLIDVAPHDGRRLGIGGKGSVIGVKAGVQHGDDHAGAVHAEIPGCRRADHAAAGGNLRLRRELIGLHHMDCLDARQSFQLRDMAIGAFQRNTVEQEKIGIAHGSLRCGLGNLRFDLLLCRNGVLLRRAACIRQSLSCEHAALLRQGGSVELHDDADKIGVLRGLRLQRFELCVLVSLQDRAEIGALRKLCRFLSRFRVNDRLIRLHGGYGRDAPQRQYQHQQERQRALKSCFHLVTSLFLFLILRVYYACAKYQLVIDLV